MTNQDIKTLNRIFNKAIGEIREDEKMYTKEQQLKKCKEELTDIDLLDLSKVVRLPKDELKNRVIFVNNKGTCQVCEESTNLDYPHHARFGVSRKDDRFLICICQECHRKIHNIGFSKVKKTREQTEEIAWQNHLEYLNELS